MRLLFATDIHLDHARKEAIGDFCQAILDRDPDGVIITGDIAEAKTITKLLKIVESVIKRPIYFCLGNHDFYFGSISEVRAAMVKLTNESKYLRYLPQVGIVELSPPEDRGGVALVGHDGWADGRYGNFWTSTVALNDYLHIKDLACFGMKRLPLYYKLNELGDEAAAYLRDALERAFKSYRKVVCATHVPPYPLSAVYNGKPSDDNWLPHFSCKAVGDVMTKIMLDRPDRELHVLCGHSHGDAEYQPLPNLRVTTGGAVYTKPEIQDLVIEV